METIRSFYETMQKTYQTVAQATRSDLPAVSSTAKTMRHAAGQASSAAKR